MLSLEECKEWDGAVIKDQKVWECREPTRTQERGKEGRREGEEKASILDNRGVNLEGKIPLLGLGLLLHTFFMQNVALAYPPPSGNCRSKMPL